MNKTELIDSIAAKTELEKTKVALVVNGFLDTVTEALADHDSVTLIGFGTFKVKHRKAREGVNPQTGKKMKIKAADVPAISFGDSLKKSVAKKKKQKSFLAKPKKKAAAKKTTAKKAVAKKKPVAKKKTTAKKKKK